MGVHAETGRALGKDFTINSLLEQGFEAVFLATGGWDSRLTRDKGAGIETPVPGVCFLVDLFRTTDKSTAKRIAIFFIKKSVLSRDFASVTSMNGH